MVQVAAHSRAWLDEGLQGQLTRRLQRAVVWSVALHLGVFILVTWVRLPQHGGTAPGVYRNFPCQFADASGQGG